MNSRETAVNKETAFQLWEELKDRGVFIGNEVWEEYGLLVKTFGDEDIKLHGRLISERQRNRLEHAIYLGKKRAEERRGTRSVPTGSRGMF